MEIIIPSNILLDDYLLETTPIGQFNLIYSEIKLNMGGVLSDLCRNVLQGELCVDILFLIYMATWLMIVFPIGIKKKKKTDESITDIPLPNHWRTKAKNKII
jgi:hypothetical protein